MNRLITPFVTKRLTSMSANNAAEAFTDWVPAVGLDECKALLVGQSVIGTSTCRFAVQTATARKDGGGTWTDIDTTNRTDAFEANSLETSLTTALATKSWARFGYLYKKGASGAYTQLDASMQTSFVSRGMMIGEMPEMTVSSAQQTTWQTAWTTKWVPAEWVNSVKTGVWLSDFVNTPEIRVAYQTATVRPSKPDAWLSAMSGGATWTAADGTNDFNTGDVALSITGKMWVRFAIQFKSVDAPTAGTLDQVTVGAVFGIRRT